MSPDIGCVSSCVLYLLNCTIWRLNSLSWRMKGWVSDFQMFRTRKNSESHCAWSSLVKGGKGLYLPNCQTNLVIDLDALSLLFCIFMNTTAYHLGRDEPSSPVSCHAPRSVSSHLGRAILYSDASHLALGVMLCQRHLVHKVARTVTHWSGSRWECIRGQFKVHRHRLSHNREKSCFDFHHLWMALNFFSGNLDLSKNKKLKKSYLMLKPAQKCQR